MIERYRIVPLVDRREGRERLVRDLLLERLRGSLGGSSGEQDQRTISADKNTEL
jgi:hypothetical protein